MPETNTEASMVLKAANDNPGGSTTVEIALTDMVRLMAKAYVANLSQKERA